MTGRCREVSGAGSRLELRRMSLCSKVRELLQKDCRSQTWFRESRRSAVEELRAKLGTRDATARVVGIRQENKHKLLADSSILTSEASSVFVFIDMEWLSSRLRLSASHIPPTGYQIQSNAGMKPPTELKAMQHKLVQIPFDSKTCPCRYAIAQSEKSRLPCMPLCDPQDVAQFHFFLRRKA